MDPDLGGGADAWVGFAYVSLISMFLGFFAWYAGLARGGVAHAVDAPAPPSAVAAAQAA